MIFIQLLTAPNSVSMSPVVCKSWLWAISPPPPPPPQTPPVCPSSGAVHLFIRATCSLLLFASAQQLPAGQPKQTKLAWAG